MSMPKQALKDQPLTEAATCYLDKYLNWDSLGPTLTLAPRATWTGTCDRPFGCQTQQCTLLVSLQDVCVCLDSYQNIKWLSRENLNSKLHDTSSARIKWALPSRPPHKLGRRPFEKGWVMCLL